MTRILKTQSLKFLDYGFFFVVFLLNSRVVINHFPSYQLLHILYGISNMFRERIEPWKPLESTAQQKVSRFILARNMFFGEL